MLGRIVLKRGNKNEVEKPFWISYADLMTAMMMLFLVTMSATLLAVTKDLVEVVDADKARAGDILDLCTELKKTAERHGGIVVDCVSNRIDFGDRARFEKNQYRLSPTSARTLRQFVPEILRISDSDLGQRWMHRVVIEGFTDSDGSYLYNLDLSLKRAQMVLCALFAATQQDEEPLSLDQQRQIRRLFMVGGFSLNAAKDTPEKSRRVEFRLEFHGNDDSKTARPGPITDLIDVPLGDCQLEKVQ